MNIKKVKKMLSIQFVKVEYVKWDRRVIYNFPKMTILTKLLHKKPERMSVQEIINNDENQRDVERYLQNCKIAHDFFLPFHLPNKSGVPKFLNIFQRTVTQAVADGWRQRRSSSSRRELGQPRLALGRFRERARR